MNLDAAHSGYPKQIRSQRTPGGVATFQDRVPLAGQRNPQHGQPTAIAAEYARHIDTRGKVVARSAQDFVHSLHDRPEILSLPQIERYDAPTRTTL